MSLTDTIRVAYPEAENDTVHTMAVTFNDRFLSQRSRIKRDAAAKGAVKKRQSVEGTARPGNSDSQKSRGIGEAKQQDESPLDNTTDMANALAEMGEAVAKMQQEILMIAEVVTAVMQAILRTDQALASKLQQGVVNANSSGQPIPGMQELLQAWLQQPGQVSASEPKDPHNEEPSQ